MNVQPSAGAISSSPRSLLTPVGSPVPDTHAAEREGLVVSQPHDVLWNFLRGSIAGTVSKTMVYPLDRLKMTYQVKGASIGSFRLTEFAQRLIALKRSEGFFSLWKGNLAAVCRTFPHSGIVFYCFDVYHPIFCNALPSHPALARLLAGGFSGVTSTCVTYPLDVWNTRMAVSYRRFQYREVAFVSVEGVRSLTRGLYPTMLGIFPYAGISFFVFDTLRTSRLNAKRRHCQKVWGGGPQHCEKHHRHTLDSLEAAICGGIAGVVSQSATYPLDTIRKMMQAHTFLYHYKELEQCGNQHPGVRDAFRVVWSHQGFRGLYNGLSLNWIKGFFAAGLAYSINEQLKKHSRPTLFG